MSALLPRTAIDGAITGVITRLNYIKAMEDQEGAIREFVFGRVVFVGLPTGSSKSLWYAALAFVFHILSVVCPLQSIMEDQVSKYRARGLQVAFVGKVQKDEAVREGVAKGNYQLVYMSPEAMLLNLKWKEMFCSDVYNIFFSMSLYLAKSFSTI